jgi:hypothetical protein
VALAPATKLARIADFIVIFFKFLFAYFFPFTARIGLSKALRSFVSEMLGEGEGSG